MTKDEALKLALEALKQIDEAMPFPVAKLAQAAIKEALAERTWVAIDDEDYIKALELCDFDKVAAFEFFEAALKAKNT